MAPVFLEEVDEGLVEILPRNHSQVYRDKFSKYNEAKISHRWQVISLWF